MDWLQIKQQAELYRRDRVYYPKRWFDEGKMMLANMYTTACNVKSYTFDEAMTDVEYTLPSDYKYVFKAIDPRYPRYDFKDYNVDSMRKVIAFNRQGAYTLYYLTETPDIVGNDSEVPEINSAFHYALAKYIAAKELEYVRPDRYKDLLQQFYQDAALADKSIRRGDVGSFRMPRRPFR